MSQNKVKDNVECALYGTSYCDILNNQSCEECTVNKLPPDEQQKAISDIEFVRAMLPGGSLDELTDAAECQLCREQPGQKPEYYAFVDYGHPEPKGTKPSAIGIRVKTTVGSIIPLQIPCCKRCRKHHLISDYLPLCVMVLVVLIGIIVVSLPPVTRALSGINELLPLLVFVVLIPVGWILGTLLANSYMKKAKAETLFDTKDIPFVRKLTALGWFPLSSDGNKAEQRMIFSKEKRKRGWFI